VKTLYVGPDDALAVRLVQFMRDKDIKPGSSGVIQVQHDHDCPKLFGGPQCACKPDFKVMDGAA
jgi:hypothetical protein